MGKLAFCLKSATGSPLISRKFLPYGLFPWFNGLSSGDKQRSLPIEAENLARALLLTQEV
jgi:hypothetical protein